MSTIAIKGAKMFQDHFNALKAEHDFSPLPASAIATYLLFHLNCDDLGLLRARDPENALRMWSDKTGIPYSTLHTGREILYKRNFIKDTFNGNDQLYEINGYGVHNTEMKLNYFRIPFSLKNSKVLKKLVSAKDSTGLIMLLDLCNAFHRDARWGKSAKELSVTRKMSSFKEKMNKNAKKVREWIESVSEIFTISPLDYQEKRPNQERLGVRKKNNPIQILIKDFTVQVKKSCLSKEDDPFHTKQVEATLRKEAVVQFKRHQIIIKKSDMKDIMAAFRQEAIKPLGKYQNVNEPFKLKRNQLFYHIFLGALENTIQYYELEKAKNPSFRFRSVGAVFRTKVRHYASQALLFDLSDEKMIIEAFKGIDALSSPDLTKLRDLWTQAEENKMKRFSYKH